MMLLLALASGIAPLWGQQLITNLSVSEDQIDRNRARLIFTMRAHQWSNKEPITVFVLPDRNTLHQRFAKQALRVYPYQLRQTWDRQVFSGTGQAPQQVDDEQEMLERVRSTSGAIGYISDDLRAEGVKQLRVTSP